MKFATEKDFAEYIDSIDGTLFKVGGSIRDRIIFGDSSGDIDYAVEGLQELNFKKVGRDFPVYLVHIAGEMREVALCRTERKTGKGYGGFEVLTDGVTIEEDLSRRDLTINAIAINVLTQERIDPFNGYHDAVAGIIRHTSDAFSEDPLRILRVARFAATIPNAKISSETFLLMMDIKHELLDIAPERIATEMFKTFEKGFDRRIFFDVLKGVGALEIIFPEIAALDVPDKHDGTAYNHVMELLRFAHNQDEFIGLLFHDLGKGVTDPAMHPAHHGHDKLGMKIANQMASRLKLSKKQKRLAEASSETHMLLKDFTTMRPAKQIRMVVRFDDILDTLLSITIIDSVRRGPIEGHFHDPVAVKDSFAPIKRQIEKVRTVIKIIDGSLLLSFGVQQDKNFSQKLEEVRIKSLKKLV